MYPYLNGNDYPKETPMSNRNRTRYANLSTSALMKAMARVDNPRRRGQIRAALVARGETVTR